MEEPVSTSTDRDVKPPSGPQRPATFLLAVVGLVVAVLLLGAGGFLWLSGKSGPTVGGPFTLENGNGQTVTDRDFRGKYLLVYFGYTFCPDVCPTTLNAVADALDKLGPKASALQPVFITVDPERDTPAVMKQYTAAFTPRLIGLTGTPEQIERVAKEYRVYYAKHRTGPGPNDYSMDHSSVLYLMSPQGDFVAPIRADASGDELASQLSKLLS
jgi:protein SCO1/2